MIITEEFTKIVEEFSNLKHISSEIEHIYSNITYYITTLVFQYNEIIEEKDHIILDNILATYSTLHNEEELSKSNIIYNSAITRTYTDEYNEYVGNLQISPEKYNILATKLQNIVIIYNVFGDAAPLLLFYKMERDYWSDIKAIMIFLNKYPEMESDSLHQIAVNDCILQELKEL